MQPSVPLARKITQWNSVTNSDGTVNQRTYDSCWAADW